MLFGRENGVWPNAHVLLLQLKTQCRLRQMPHLVYWYGEPDSRRYGIVPQASAVAYDQADGQFGAAKDRYDSLRKKVANNVALTSREERMVQSMKEMYKDLGGNPHELDAFESESESDESESESHSVVSEAESESSEAESESSGDETMTHASNGDVGSDVEDIEELNRIEKRAQAALDEARLRQKKASIAKIRAETFMVNRRTEQMKAEAKHFIEESAKV